MLLCQVKDNLWMLLDEKTSEPTEDMIVVTGDLIGHLGVTMEGFSNDTKTRINFVLIRHRVFQELATNSKISLTRASPRKIVHDNHAAEAEITTKMWNPNQVVTAVKEGSLQIPHQVDEVSPAVDRRCRKVHGVSNTNIVV